MITWTAPDNSHKSIAGKTFTNGTIIRQDSKGLMYAASDSRGDLMVDFGEITIEGKARSLKVRIDDKPELSAQVYAAIAAGEAADKAEADALAANVPGLDELHAAMDDEERYRRAFNRMMDDEGNDGVNPPRPVKVSARDVAAKFPRAAAYVRAEEMSCGAHWAKMKAGDEAMELLASGGSIEDADKLMNNWIENNNVYVD